MSMTYTELDKNGEPKKEVRLKEPVYNDGRTKQAFKDQCDINKILKKAQGVGTIAHLQKYPEAVYGEFDGVDLLGAYERQARAQEIFDDLPSEIRTEFGHSAIEFVKFAANPENNKRLAQILPKIAEPGTYFPNPIQRGGQGAAAATAPVETPPGTRQEAAGDPPAQDGVSPPEHIE